MRIYFLLIKKVIKSIGAGFQILQRVWHRMAFGRPALERAVGSCDDVKKKFACVASFVFLFAF